MGRGETPESLALAGALAEVLVCGALLPFTEWRPLTPTLILVLAGLGVFGTLGTLLNCFALQHTAAANVAQFQYTQIVLGALLGWLIWDEVPSARVWAGAAVIIGAGLLVAARATRSDAPA